MQVRSGAGKDIIAGILTFTPNEILAMDQPTDRNRPSKHYLHKEHEDPHFHDDDQETVEEREKRAAHAATRKPNRRFPPPKRRFAED